MILWTDAHLSPALAPWLAQEFGVEAVSLRDLGLRDAKDQVIYFAARRAGAVFMTKDSDFVDLLDRHGPPPSILWITLGNTSNDKLRTVLARHWNRIRAEVERGEKLIEIADERRRS